MLTKEADKLLAAAYKEYRKRRRDGWTRDNAAEFDPYYWNHKKPFEHWNESDIDSAMNELAGTGMIRKDIVGGFVLKPDTVADLENSNLERLGKFFSVGSEVITLVTDIAGIVPKI